MGRKVLLSKALVLFLFDYNDVNYDNHRQYTNIYRQQLLRAS